MTGREDRRAHDLRQRSGTVPRGRSRRTRPHRTGLAPRPAFDYAGRRIDAATGAGSAIVAGPAATVRVVRDLQAEPRAVNRLARTPLDPRALAAGFYTRSPHRWDHTPSNEDGFPDFLVNQAEALRAEAWPLEYAPRWPRVYPPGPNGDLPQFAAVPAHKFRPKVGAPTNWFEIEFAARIEGQLDGSKNRWRLRA